MAEKRETTASFDVDEWIRLWKDDPQGAERRRQEEIEALIMSAPEERRQKLRRLQWRIDVEREKHDNPMGRCIALHRMLTDHLWSENGFYAVGPRIFAKLSVELYRLNSLVRSVDPDTMPDTVPQPSRTALILPFTKRKDLV